MTLPQSRVLLALRIAYPNALTSAEIAPCCGLPTRAVATICTYLRGNGWITDGSTAELVGGGIAHTPASSPVRWKYLRDQSEAPLNRVFHGRPVERLANR